MTQRRASRNRTLTLTDQEAQIYAKKCVTLSHTENLDKLINKTINGNTFSALKLLPKNSVDLLVVDPPYNMSKEFHGNKFNSMKDIDYEKFTREWIDLCLPLLKPNASIYVCCDWKSSLIIGAILKEKFDIKNRITWQREKGRGAKTNWKNGMEDIWFATVSKKDYTFNLEDVMVRRKVITSYKSNEKPKDWEEAPQGNFRNTCPSNFWDDCTVPYWSMPENTDHPAQKPEKLITKIPEENPHVRLQISPQS